MRTELTSCCLLGLLSGAPALAETPTTPVPKKPASGTLAPPSPTPSGDDKRLVLRPFVAITGLELVRSSGGRSQSISPNPPVSVGLAGSYAGFGASLSVAVDSVYSEQGLEASDALDFSLFWQGERWAVDAFVQRYASLYESLEDPDGETRLCTDPGACGQWPDGLIQRYGATVTYAWEPELSLRSAFAQAGGRRESAGSWLLLAGADHARVTLGGEPHVKAALTGVFGGGGYAHHWVSTGGWWFAFLVQAGLGPIWLEEQGDPRLETGLKLNLKLSAGYDADGWFVGLVGFGDRIGPVGGDEAEGTLDWQSLHTELFFGLRW